MKISGFLSSVALALAMAVAPPVPLAASAVTWRGATATSAPSAAFQATIRAVDEETRARMIGVSWKPGCPVPIDDLRIIEMNFIGFDGAVHRKKPTGRQYRKLDGQQEAKLVAVACSAPPEGKGRWTLQMLADRLVELAVVDAVSDETVRRVLKKTF